ncbi:GTP-binding protein [Candidatus Woesearchaeota archaeon]|nr:GTP-binding protein [Candidatus Woesearchaeota archaeon]
MPDYNDQIKQFEDELAKMQYNKRTQHHYGLVRAKIARLREEQVKRSSGGKKGEGYSVKKTGDATVVLVGFPSSGKSTLLNTLTGAESEVGAYEFTTLNVIPGLLEYKNSKIQILDVPGIVHGAASGRGRGKEVLAVMRTADLALVLVDVHKPEQLPALQKEINDSGLRLNQRKPNVKITKKARGGVSIATTVKLNHLDNRTVMDILKEFRTFNADVLIREDITADQLIDVIEANKIYIPSIVVVNKIDIVSEEELEKIVNKVNPDLCISADKKVNTDRLKDMIFDKLNFIRVYCKEVGKKADMDVPMIMRKGQSIKDMCEKLHRDFVTKFKYAKVWGKSSKFPGQRFLLNHELVDNDIVELHIS